VKEDERDRCGRASVETPDDFAEKLQWVLNKIDHCLGGDVQTLGEFGSSKASRGLRKEVRRCRGIREKGLQTSAHFRRLITQSDIL
jgi:hypothetical protein